MKIIIFAGGFGRRLWPISLSASPKQFEPIIGDRSTIQLAVERVLPEYGAANIFISTNERYADIIRRQVPGIPVGNVIGEPTRRDLAAAVGLAVTHLHHLGQDDEPVAILWGDNYMKDTATFRGVLSAAEQIVANGKAKLVFIGETPRFANANLGWIQLGKEQGLIDGQKFYEFGGLTYRPEPEVCARMFASGDCVWNTGYFVTRIDYLKEAYRHLKPEMWRKLQKIGEAVGTAEYSQKLETIYPQLESISFDDAILTHLDPADACVLYAPMGWSDPGTLYALKESIEPDPAQNVTRGLVIDSESSDSLIYNYEPDKLLMAVGLDGMIVVNTPHATLVVHKDKIRQIKELVEGFAGTDLEKFT